MGNLNSEVALHSKCCTTNRFDFAFNFVRKFKPFRAQRGAKVFDFAFDFLRKSMIKFPQKPWEIMKINDFSLIFHQI